MVKWHEVCDFLVSILLCSSTSSFGHEGEANSFYVLLFQELEGLIDMLVDVLEQIRPRFFGSKWTLLCNRGTQTYEAPNTK